MIREKLKSGIRVQTDIDRLEALCRIATERYPIELENLIAQGYFIVREYRQALSDYREEKTNSLVVEAQAIKRKPIIKRPKIEFTGDVQDEDHLLRVEERKKS